MYLIRIIFYSILGFSLLSTTLVRAQNQEKVDSLLSEYRGKSHSDEDRMTLLHQIAFNELNDIDLSLAYSDTLVRLASSVKNYHFLYEGYLNIGNRHRLLGNLDLALESLFKSSEAAKKGNNLEDEAVSYTSIADMYSEIGNANNAELYYNKGIDLLRNMDESLALASALFNAGDELFNNNKYDKALKNFEEAGNIFDEEESAIGKAYTLGNIGMVYAEQGKDVLAETKINEAIQILEELEDYYSISEYLTYMSDIYRERQAMKNAISYAERSLELAQRNGIKKQLSESNLVLSELYEQSGNTVKALGFYRDHITYRDSIINLENVQKAFDIRTTSELSQQEKVYELQKKNQRLILYATALALFFIGLMAIGLYRRNKFVQSTNVIIANEKERSDALLLNILPEDTAKELKEHGKVKAKKYESVTVLFTDFKGFTAYAENLPPEKLVETVDFYFSKFDEIIQSHGLEKIKTIGDAYMCAAGLNTTETEHAHSMVNAALDIEAFVKTSKNDPTIETSFDIRIGISTGPVVAGVVGTKKFAYDIWGDTVNVASRMESNSEAGKINLSHHTYQIVKDDFECEFRGKIPVKNRGEMNMYFVNGPKLITPNVKSKTAVA
jgi:class 3 adenylate cyclase